MGSPVRRILLVEHDTAEARRIRRACRGSGGALRITVYAELHEVECILRVPTHRYDLVVIDLGNPECAGHELFQAPNDELWRPPVLLLVDPGEEHRAAEWIERGAADALIKDANGGYLTLLSSKLTRVIDAHFESLARRRAEAELRERAERNRIVLDHVTEGVVTIDEHGNVESFNPAAETIFGHRADEVIGRNVKMLMAGDDHRNHDAYLRRHLETGKGGIIGKGREVVARRKDGTTFPVEITIDEVRFGGRSLFTGIVRDITERELAEKALAQAKQMTESANRAKSEFLANMSHELRTPLTAIIGFAEVMQNQMLGPLGNERYLEYIEHIGNSGRHLLNLIEDILDVSRIEAGRLKLDEGEVDLTSIIESSLHLLREQTAKARLEIKMKIPDDLPCLYADERRIKQILFNLLSNAVKFTPEGGEVRIEACVDSAGGLKFTVADTGIGIARKDIPKAFSPFGQVDSRLQRRYEGTGLGLPLVKSLVELHGGALKLSSRVGRGTTVTVRFPAGRKAQPRAATSRRAASFPTSQAPASPAAKIAAPHSPDASPAATVVPLRRETG
jgi:PAS domain S-box-containing protein